MSDKYNWAVFGGAGVTALTSGSRPTYDLFNEYALQRLIHGRREYGINLVWEEMDLSAGQATPTPSLFVRSERPGAVTIEYNEPVAIGIRGGGYLKEETRKYGISLVWSETPEYEWRFIPEDMLQIGTPVQLGQLVGLHNDREPDTLFYDPRRYGVNLKWLLDKGQHNSRPWYAGITDAITGILNQLVNVVADLVWRVLNIFDFICTLLGWMVQKKIKVRILVLRDSHGDAVLADDGLDQDPAALAADQLKIERATEVISECLSAINVTAKFIAPGKSLYEVLPFPAPGYALKVKADPRLRDDDGDIDLDGGAYGEDLNATGRYFRRHAGGPLIGGAVTIFVVKEVAGSDVGYAPAGLATNYVVVESAGFDDFTPSPTNPVVPEARPTTPMHEIGHACFLYHFDRRKNLMRKSTPRGIKMRRWQAAVLRSSRHVTYTTTGVIG